MLQRKGDFARVFSGSQMAAQYNKAWVLAS